jgi:tRNA-splicing ligase RtcB (3'-phosphate/5'-hydroxy nucleic acid ligase)
MEPTQQREPQFSVIEGTGAVIKAWNRGVPFEAGAITQTQKVASLPFVKGVALMPDCHIGYGCTVGSVIAADGAICPSIVGVDIGCGMIAVRTNLTYEDVAGKTKQIYDAIYKAVPTGRTNDGGEGDRGAWHDVPLDISDIWFKEFFLDYEYLCAKHPGARSKNAAKQLGTLGTGNHFIEVCCETNFGGEHYPPNLHTIPIWIVIHSGSRGLGNRIGTYFTNLAKEQCDKYFITLPDPDLAYFPKGNPEYDDYIAALKLAQKFAWRNREIMMWRVLEAIGAQHLTLPVSTDHALYAEDGPSFVHCHHNYMNIEKHFGKNLIITRKGAVRAETGDLAVIPGSMGARTYIARGLGSRDSYCSCSHGAGRQMGRNQARKTITVAEHVAATQGIECCKTEDVIDESPAAYKSIEAVMAAQSDLVEPILALRQIVCVKGIGDSKGRKR